MRMCYGFSYEFCILLIHIGLIAIADAYNKGPSVDICEYYRVIKKLDEHPECLRGERLSYSQPAMQ